MTQSFVPPVSAGSGLRSHDRLVFITGGSGCIGGAIARAFAEAGGYDVVYTYNSRPVEIAGCVGVPLDVRDTARVAELAEAYEADVLINNAGVSRIGLFQDTSDGDWRDIIDTNLTGAFNCTRAFLLAMLRRKGGCVINIASVWGVVGASCEVAYSSAKAGLIGMTKALAKEVGLSGVRVNCIAPGVIESPMNGFLAGDEPIFADIALGRMGKPSDVAQAALWLAGAEYVTGQTVNVCGGLVI